MSQNPRNRLKHLKALPHQTLPHENCNFSHVAVCQNLVPLVNIKIAGKWMVIPLKMVLIGIDPYPCPILKETQTSRAAAPRTSHFRCLDFIIHSTKPGAKPGTQTTCRDDWSTGKCKNLVITIIGY